MPEIERERRDDGVAVPSLDMTVIHPELARRTAAGLCAVAGPHALRDSHARAALPHRADRGVARVRRSKLLRGAGARLGLGLARYNPVFFDTMIRDQGWELLAWHRNELTGNGLAKDRGSVYYLIAKDS